MLDTMDDITYAFYLAYGMSPEDEELDSLLYVEMYNIIESGFEFPVEASHSTVLT